MTAQGRWDPVRQVCGYKSLQLNIKWLNATFAYLAVFDLVTLVIMAVQLGLIAMLTGSYKHRRITTGGNTEIADPGIIPWRQRGRLVRMVIQQQLVYFLSA